MESQQQQQQGPERASHHELSDLAPEPARSSAQSLNSDAPLHHNIPISHEGSRGSHFRSHSEGNLQPPSPTLRNRYYRFHTRGRSANRPLTAGREELKVPFEDAVDDDEPLDNHHHHQPPPHSSAQPTAILAHSNQPYTVTEAQLNPRPGFHDTRSGSINGSGYDETEADVIAVPCPGADPLETWARATLPDGFFSPTRLSRRPTAEQEAEARAGVEEGVAVADAAGPLGHFTKPSPVWVLQGIRKCNPRARVLLYRHRALTEGLTLDSLAQDLLDEVLEERKKGLPSRPMFFIGHSVGGLVVKSALVRASKMKRYRDIVRNCHGVTFFATPHRGSSYLSMASLGPSIQSLLHLSGPLPISLLKNIRLDHKSLLELNEDFRDLASGLRLWTFYETVDSPLSGPGSAGRHTHLTLVRTGHGPDSKTVSVNTTTRPQQHQQSGHRHSRQRSRGEVRFGAPLVSIKSSIVDLRHEQVFAIDNNHALCASFGRGNLRILRSYLHELAVAINDAISLSKRYTHTPLCLKDHVKVDLIGFYDEPDAESDIAVTEIATITGGGGDEESRFRLYFTSLHLGDFLSKGPDRCLEERLRRVLPGEESQQGPRQRSRSHSHNHHNHGPLRGLGLFSARDTLPSSLHKILAGSGVAADAADTTSDHSPSASDPIYTPLSVATSTPPAARRRPLSPPSLSVPALLRPRSQSPHQRPSMDGGASTISEPVIESVAFDLAGESLPRKSDSIDLDQKDLESRLGHDTDFSHPDQALQKFMWIHLPFNNPLWVKDVFKCLSRTSGPVDITKLLSKENWVKRHVHGRHSRAQPSFVWPTCVFSGDPVTTPKPLNDSFLPLRPGPSVASAAAIAPRYLYLCLPYLHFDTYSKLIQRRKLVERRIKQGRARPVPKEVADLESLELRVIWEYLGFDLPVNLRRTLDQYGYPSLRDTYARDDDQMLYKLTKRKDLPINPLARPAELSGGGESAARLPLDRRIPSLLMSREASRLDEMEDDAPDPDAEVCEGNVLMVDQLWLWVIDTHSLATFFPKRASSPKEGNLFQQADLWNSVYNELNGDLTGQCDTTWDLAAFITLHAITVLLNRSSHPDLEIFRLFEEAIGMLTERMTSSLKKFHMQTLQNVEDEESEDDDPEVDAESGGNRSESIKKRHQRRLQKVERENRENTSTLLEIRDLEDELNTISNLFTDQEKVLKTMWEVYFRSDLADVTVHGRAYLQEARESLTEYQQLVKDMVQRILTLRNDCEKLLELHQRHAQVSEVRWSRLQAELASSQNLSVMIFTTFTIIFLPLSFFTSLFGMNTKEWSSDYQGELPSFAEVGAISLPLSALIIITALIAAFSSRVQAWVRKNFRISRMALRPWLTWVLRSLRALGRRGTPTGAAVDGSWRLQDDSTTNQEVQKDLRDFWPTIRRQRTLEYRIPDANLNPRWRRRQNRQNRQNQQGQTSRRWKGGDRGVAAMAMDCPAEDHGKVQRSAR